eukprot:1159859-Pelagomonas_calceolata.AAC.2
MRVPMGAKKLRHLQAVCRELFCKSTTSAPVLHNAICQTSLQKFSLSAAIKLAQIALCCDNLSAGWGLLDLMYAADVRIFASENALEHEYITSVIIWHKNQAASALNSTHYSHLCSQFHEMQQEGH